MRVRRVVSSTLLCLTPIVAPIVAVHGQSHSETAVRAVVDSFFAAVAREQWDSAAHFVDLPRFEPILKSAVASARSALPQPPATAEELMASDSTMPRAVAEWEAARSNRFRSRRPFDDYSSQFAGVTSQRVLFSLTVADAATRWIAAQDGRVQMREEWRRMGCGIGTLPTMPLMARPVVLGIAFRDDSTALVIHSDDQFRGMGNMHDERVVPVHRTQAGWRIEPRDDLLRPSHMFFSVDGCPGKK
jgi:hypothetical protein